MKAQELEQVVSGFGAYPAWQASVAARDTAQKELTPPDLDSPDWLLAKHAYLNLRSAVSPARTALQIEIAQSQDALPLQFRLGLLQGLEQGIGLHKITAKDRLITLGIARLDETPDLKLSDISYKTNHLFTYAEVVGTALQDVQRALPRHSKPVAAAVLSVGPPLQSGPLYRATDVEYYHVTTQRRELLHETSVGRGVDGLQAEFTIPRLSVVAAAYNARTDKIDAKPALHPGRVSTIAIPKIEQLDKRDENKSATKLLLGKEALAFAKKHQADVLADQAAQAVARREAERLAFRRFGGRR